MLRTVAGRQDATLQGVRVAVLSSHRAPGADYLLREDPNRGERYEIAAFVASDPANADLGRFVAAGVPTAVHDIRAFYAARGARLTDLGPRPDYDGELRDALTVHRPDLVVLCGYLHILTASMLDAYPGRIVNIHDSDLALLGRDGRPKYRGLRSTRDAVFAGEPVTRSTVHLVTPEVDVGPVLVRSWPFPVHALVEDARRWGTNDILKAYAYAQREWMMRAAWGPLLARAIELFVEGAPASFTTRPHAEPVLQNAGEGGAILVESE
jgi:folate-dependent phosphoribosylglycinamide formyltransferase PurN